MQFTCGMQTLCGLILCGSGMQTLCGLIRCYLPYWIQAPFGPDPISPKTCVLSGPLVALGPVVGVTEVAAYQPEKAGVAMTVSQVQERKVPEPPSCSGSSRFLRASSHAEAPDDP